MSEYFHKMGWLPDYPDFRDFGYDKADVPIKLQSLGQEDSISQMLKKAGITDSPRLSLPVNSDLRQWCSPVEDQLRLGSCTAHAGVGLVEYFERRAFGNHIDASRLFHGKHMPGIPNYSRFKLRNHLFGSLDSEWWI